MKELNFLKYATIIFMLFILFWVNFGGYILGTQGNNETKTAQTENLINEESRLRAELRDAEILGKFWNSKGHFVVVYDEETKVAKIYPVKEKEWGEYRVGELY
ncbi:hypothetical protein RI569_04395 [Streptococcus pneumoniae]|jgi:hypothetical protein|nr:hypothetical protein [Streptococcus pneumoniae]